MSVNGQFRVKSNENGFIKKVPKSRFKEKVKKYSLLLFDTDGVFDDSS